MLVHQSIDPERLAAGPRGDVELELPGGAVVRETSAFDAATRRDEGTRRLTLGNGRVLEGRFSIRYYGRDELPALAARAGLPEVELHDGGALGLDPDVLVLRAIRRPQG